MTNTPKTTAIADELAVILATITPATDGQDWATIAQAARTIARMAEDWTHPQRSAAITRHNGQLVAPYTFARDLIDTARTDYEQMTA